MVTPPSEEESPKKTKFEQIFVDQIGHNNYVQPPIHMHVPIVPPGQPVSTVPIVPTVLPQVVVQNNNNNNNNNSSNNNMNNHILPHNHIPNAISTTQDLTAMNADAKKSARPFKAYPKDSLSLGVVSEMIYDQTSNDAYSEFRKKMLDSVRRSNEGTNIKMRRWVIFLIAFKNVSLKVEFF